MFNKLRTYLSEGLTYSGLEIFESDGQEVYHLLELGNHKNEFHITNRKKFNNLSKLQGELRKNVPLFLTINSSKVLTKKMESTLGVNNPEALVNHAFPNLDLNNFYYEIIQVPDNPIVTISKKDHVDDILQRLSKLKIQVFTFSLGICSLPSVLKYMDSKTINASNFCLTTDTKNISSVSVSNNHNELEYHINGLDISSNYLLTFSHIIRHLSNLESICNFEAGIKKLKSEFWNHRFFNLGIKISLTFFIVLLLTNFFAFDHYQDKVDELNQAIASTRIQKEQVTQLNLSVTQKEERVNTLTASPNSRSTYYLDEFAQITPNSVLLNGIKFQPLSKPVRETKPVLLEKNKLLVSGISKSASDFSFWVEEMEKKDWITFVETLDYDYISKDTSKFLIEIGIHEN